MSLERPASGAGSPVASRSQQWAFASLPMYDWPETASVWDLLWRDVRENLLREGMAADPVLRREADHRADWLKPGLILGQTCGWPFVSGLEGKVEPFARFDFAIANLQPGEYFSVFVMRSGEPGPAKYDPAALEPLIRNPQIRVAINSPDSQSGFRVLGESLAGPYELPRGRAVLTGNHRDSIRAVAQGNAEIAAIDGVSWQFALEHEPMAKALMVVARSRPAPGLPMICAPGFAAQTPAIFHALHSAIGALPQSARLALHLRGVVAANAGDYSTLRQPPYGNLILV